MRLQSYAKFFNHQTFPDYFSAFFAFFIISDARGSFRIRQKQPKTAAFLSLTPPGGAVMPRLGHELQKIS